MSYTSYALGFSKAPPTLNEVVVTKKETSTYEALLEFNEDLLVSDLHGARLFYTGLMESTQYSINENVIEALSSLIANTIIIVTDFFQYVFTGRSGKRGENTDVTKSTKSIEDNLKDIKELAKKFKYEDFRESRGTLALYKGAIRLPTMADICGGSEAALQAASDSCVKLAEYLNGKPSDSSEIDTRVQDTIKLVDDAATTIKNVNIEDLFAKEKHEDADIAKWVDERLQSLAEYNYKAKADGSDIDNYGELSTILKALKGFEESLKKNGTKIEESSPTVKSCITKISGLCAIIMQKLASYNSKMYGRIKEETKGIRVILRKLLNDEDDDESIDESYGIDWLHDMVLMEEMDMQFGVYQILKEGLVEEAVIRSNPDADVLAELYALNEAIGDKLKSKFQNMVAKIKEIFAKFMEKLRANFTTTKHYLDKYRKVLLQSKVPNDWKTKDILAGMDRVLNYEIPAFTYNEIKDSLDTHYHFFQKIESHNGANIHNKFQPSPDATITEENCNPNMIGNYFKEYFGCAGPDVQLKATQIQTRIKDIFDYMYDISKIERNIKDNIGRVEKMRDIAIRQAGVQKVDHPTPVGPDDDGQGSGSNTGGQTGGTGGQAGQTGAGGQPIVAGYFYADAISYLLEAEPIQNNNNNQQGVNGATPTNMTGQVAKNMKNVQDVNNKNTENNEKEYGTAGSPVEEVEARVNVYIEVAIKILEAKLTAVEFLRMEFMTIFRDIVGTYVEGEAKDAAEAKNTSRFTGQPEPRETGNTAGKTSSAAKNNNRSTLRQRAARMVNGVRDRLKRRK